VFTKPWKVKYNNVHLLAVILGSIHRYHPQFSITCVDELLEQITHGLEFNDVKYNQRRIAQVKYLGELYVYRMVDSAVIFDTMYKILTFGHEGGTPRPDVENLWDMPNDWFRIRLVCILLETCGGFFDKGLAKTKLDFFISFFQYYFNTKDKLSPDIEFAIQDAFAVISPSLRMIGNLEEAAKQFAEAVKENYQKDQNEKISNEVEEIEEDSMSEDGDDDEDAVVEEDEKSSADEDAVDAAEDSDEVQSSDEEDEQIVVTRQEEERDPALDADFDRELAKLMAESMDARKLERKTFFDVPLPLRRKEREATADDHGENAVIPEPTLVKFSLLSKRGNKQQVCQWRYIWDIIAAEVFIY
jgi:regulator of nonsense transcripts 2